MDDETELLPETEEDERKKKRKNAVWIVLTVLLGVVALLILAIFVLDIYINVNYFAVEVSGTSMEHTLQNEDYLYAKKKFEIERGEIAIISVENHRAGTFFGENTEFIIKRIIAVGGDSVRISDEGEVYVKYADAEDFVLIEESYVSAPTVTYGRTEWMVGEGQIFFMGDNRVDSYDSRRVGCFEEEDVVGVVPQWSVDMKKTITGWEHFRAIIRGQEKVPSRGE